MPPKICCCSKECRLAEDNFNRPDANPPTGQWSVVDGEWKIEDGVLVSITPGPIATTVCHPSWAEKGSFRSQFTLRNYEDGKVYRFTAGDPEDPEVEGRIELTQTSPETFRADGYIVVGSEERTFQNYIFSTGLGSFPIAVGFCYAPGLQASLALGLVGEIANESRAEICIADGGERCWDGLGNFAFVEGDFDDWIYDVHRVDDLNGICPHCECPCGEGSGAEHTVRCWPDELTLTIVNGSTDCPAIPPSYTLYTRSENGGTGFLESIVEPVDYLRSWISDKTVMDGWSFRWKLDCEYAFDALYDLTYPLMRLSLIIYTDGGTDWVVPSLPPMSTVVGYVGFDATYPEFISAIHSVDFARSEAASLSNSTCNPILLRFPPFRDRRLVYGYDRFFCVYSHSTSNPDGEEFGYIFNIEITE